MQGEKAGMPNRIETRSARVKILLSHSIDEAGAEHTAVGQLHISTTMNQLRMLQEIYLEPFVGDAIRYSICYILLQTT